MRIELPHPTWADAAQRAHDDAHTLTLPEGGGPLVAEPWCEGDELRRLRVEVANVRQPAITLTF